MMKFILSEMKETSTFILSKTAVDLNQTMF